MLPLCLQRSDLNSDEFWQDPAQACRVSLRLWHSQEEIQLHFTHVPVLFFFLLADIPPVYSEHTSSVILFSVGLHTALLSDLEDLLEFFLDLVLFH